MVRRLSALFLFAVCAAPMPAAVPAPGPAVISVSASISPASVDVDARFSVKISAVCVGDADCAFDVPVLSGLKNCRLLGDSVSDVMTVSNGTRYYSRTYGYVLKPLAPGTAVFDRAGIRCVVDSRERFIATDPVQVVVRHSLKKTIRWIVLALLLAGLGFCGWKGIRYLLVLIKRRGPARLKGSARGPGIPGPGITGPGTTGPGIAGAGSSDAGSGDDGQTGASEAAAMGISAEGQVLFSRFTAIRKQKTSTSKKEFYLELVKFLTRTIAERYLPGRKTTAETELVAAVDERFKPDLEALFASASTVRFGNMEPSDREIESLEILIERFLLSK